jgi:hypothetical protein
VRGDLATLVTPFSYFRVSGDGTKPDFTKLSFADYGLTVGLGAYEASADGILYEFTLDDLRRTIRSRRPFDSVHRDRHGFHHRRLLETEVSGQPVKNSLRDGNEFSEGPVPAIITARDAEHTTILAEIYVAAPAIPAIAAINRRIKRDTIASFPSGDAASNLSNLSRRFVSHDDGRNSPAGSRQRSHKECTPLHSPYLERDREVGNNLDQTIGFEFCLLWGDCRYNFGWAGLLRLLR